MDYSTILLIPADYFFRELNSRKAFHQAIRNIEVHYPVVGVLELLKETLEMAECHVKTSRFFQGARTAFLILSTILEEKILL